MRTAYSAALFCACGLAEHTTDYAAGLQVVIEALDDVAADRVGDRVEAWELRDVACVVEGNDPVGAELIENRFRVLAEMATLSLELTEPMSMRAHVIASALRIIEAGRDLVDARSRGCDDTEATADGEEPGREVTDQLVHLVE